MVIEEALLLDNWQENDARSVERKHLNEILDKDNRSETLKII